MARHYLQRIFLQLRAARDAGAFIALSEGDLLLLKEVQEFVSSRKMHTPFDLPDLSDKVIEPDSFCDGLLNFAPPDIRSVAAVRSDPVVQQYAAKIRTLLGKPSDTNTQAAVLDAMREAYQKFNRIERVENVFEVGSWLVKPFHYVPIVGEVLTGVEDIKDMAIKWADRQKTDREWCILGVRMTDIAVRDYLRRKDNIP